MAKYTEEWEALASQEGAHIDTYEDIVLFKRDDGAEEEILGIALDQAYEIFRSMGASRFYLPGSYEEVEDIDWKECLLGRKKQGEGHSIQGHIQDMFFEGREIKDLSMVDISTYSNIYLLKNEGNEVAAESERRNTPYLLKEFLNLYTASEVLKEIDRDLELGIKAATPYFANPFILFEEYIDSNDEAERYISLKEGRTLEFEKRYRGIAIELTEELGLPVLLRNIEEGWDTEQSGETFYLVDPAVWSSSLRE